MLSVHVALHGSGFRGREVAVGALSDAADDLDVFRCERSIADGEGSGRPVFRVFCHGKQHKSREIKLLRPQTTGTNLGHAYCLASRTSVTRIHQK